MSRTIQPFATLSSGNKMPLMGFGTLMNTLQPDEDAATRMVETALDIGYRHLDTAQVYRTEGAVGKAVRRKIEEGVIKREDVFITTKLWRNAAHREDVVPSLKGSLAKLGLEYVDLFLIHWPTSFKSGEDLFPKDANGKYIYENIDYVETWKAMEDCVRLGFTKSIGLSNFNSLQIQRILDNCEIKPANHQIESHPFLTNEKLINFCHKKEISIAVYAPLVGFNVKMREEKGWPTIFTHETILKISKEHNRTPAQVALRFQIQRGVAVLPKSEKPDRMLENFQALDFELTAEDMKEIAKLDQNMRLNNEFPDHPQYPFGVDF